MTLSRDKVFSILESVRDPEVPVVSVIDLGIVRDVVLEGDTTVVKITPTYSGCPALAVIQSAILTTLREHGIPNSRVELVYSPPWTTDWLTEEGKSKLKAYGIAPPGRCHEEKLVLLTSRTAETVPCPFCDSKQTELRSSFGSTACKALHFCVSCQQPFEHFKPH